MKIQVTRSDSLTLLFDGNGKIWCVSRVIKHQEEEESIILLLLLATLLHYYLQSEGEMTTVSDLLLKSIDLLKHWVFIYDDAYINSWHLNNLFVAEATFFNITVTFFILCFWILNRQTHIRDTKGKFY